MTIILSDAEPSVGGNYEFLTLRRGHDQFLLIHSRQFLTLRRAHYGGSYELLTLRRGHVYFLLIHSRQFLVFCRGRQVRVGLGSGQGRVKSDLSRVRSGCFFGNVRSVRIFFSFAFYTPPSMLCNFFPLQNRAYLIVTITLNFTCSYSVSPDR
jgi:hypothetical protein